MMLMCIDNKHQIYENGLNTSLKHYKKKDSEKHLELDYVYNT